MIERFVRPMWAFVFRDWHLTRRYFSWVVVFVFYAIVNSATIALIGKAQGDFRLTLTLLLGVLLWSFLSAMYNEIANSISYERWEGTLEYTFMAPVSRLIHLSGVSLFAVIYSVLRTVVILIGLVLFIQVSVSGANLFGVLVVLLVASLAFMGLGLMAAILPVMSPENGAQATNIFQGVLLLVSGIYYPVEVLPSWVQPLAYLSPATYALEASRKLMGINNPDSAPGHLIGAPLSAVLPELGILLLMGVILIPAGLWVFHQAERWAKRTGKLKRTG
ncbi:ABC transporter permease [Meiothermus granaticius]|uniref:Transport permease protein n=1 Tax=Meiothermus granaticius NBRC 107808 TaxID=1227551 RepID=A0A399F6K9_9DEIN|nr:ABC transporter permease [Meiothermus granaticius]MCL6528084.1 ABC transporter permease [Thermaceae bacterium]RIH91266.1 daunorubicin resistance ABC transporter membrane protein [Meiothermus granaticius NBRC 107808]GEM86073.1 multidrug ABC transporter permease [Meiothermus granaticius NBRC 107808]